MTLFSGQMVKTGHFLQPTARAMGQRVISLLRLVRVCAAGKSRGSAPVVGLQSTGPRNQLLSVGSRSMRSGQYLDFSRISPPKKIAHVDHAQGHIGQADEG